MEPVPPPPPALAPVPARATDCGLPVALSVKVSVALKDPLAAGVKVTLILQLAPAATLDPQLFVSAKSLGFVPAIEIAVILKAALPELLNVTVWAELVVATVWLAKVRLDGERLATGAGSGSEVEPEAALSATICIVQPLFAEPVAA